MRDTQRKGDIAVVTAIASFTKRNFDVSLPITESAAYDIVIDVNNALYRIQVRYSKGREVELRRIHSNAQGYVIKKTKVNAYDWLYVLNESGDEFLIKECLDGRRSIHTQEKYLLTNTL